MRTRPAHSLVNTNPTKSVTNANGQSGTLVAFATNNDFEPSVLDAARRMHDRKQRKPAVQEVLERVVIPENNITQISKDP